jgi:hypothetical protein
VLGGFGGQNGRQKGSEGAHRSAMGGASACSMQRGEPRRAMREDASWMILCALWWRDRILSQKTLWGRPSARCDACGPLRGSAGGHLSTRGAQRQKLDPSGRVVSGFHGFRVTQTLSPSRRAQSFTSFEDGHNLPRVRADTPPRSDTCSLCTPSGDALIHLPLAHCVSFPERFPSP